MTSSEPASLGTLFDLISYSLDVLRSPPPPPPPTPTPTPTPTPMIDLTRACSETLESTLVLAVSQLLLHSASLAQQQQQDSAAASSGGNPPPPPPAPSSSHSQMMDTEPLNGTGSAGSGQQSVGERQRALLELASETTELLDKAAALLTTSSSSSSSSATKKKDDMDVDSRRKRLAEVLKARLRVWCSPATAGGGTGTTASGGGVGNGSEA